MKKGLFLITMLFVLSLSLVTSFAADLRVNLEAIDQNNDISTVVGNKEGTLEFQQESPAAVVGIWTGVAVHTEDWSIQFHKQPYTLGWVKLGTYDMSKCTSISMFIENDSGAVYTDKDGVGTKLQFSKTEKFEPADIIAEGVPPEKIGWGLGFDNIEDQDGLGKLVVNVTKTDYNGPVYIRFAYREIIQYNEDGTPQMVDNVKVVRNDGVNIFKLAFNGDVAAATTTAAPTSAVSPTASVTSTASATKSSATTQSKDTPKTTVVVKPGEGKPNSLVLPIIIISAILVAGGVATFIIIQKKKK